MAASTERLLRHVRKIALALPQSNERASHGMPTFWVDDKKTFASFADRHHGVAYVALWFAAPPGAQQALVRSDSARFFLPPYVAHRGWTGLMLDAGTDWKLVTALLTDAFCTIAPARLAALCHTAGTAS